MKKNIKSGLGKRKSNFNKNDVKIRDKGRATKVREKIVENVEEDDDYKILVGRNAVLEAIKSGKNIDTIYVASGKREGSLITIVSKAKEKNILIKEVDAKKLITMSGDLRHQGVIAYSSPYVYYDIADLLQDERKPLILILDQIEDPHNFGAIIRSAEAFGVTGIIIPKRRTASVTRTVSRSSAGAVEHIKIARVNNLNQAIDELKEKGIWVFGADMNGESITGIKDFDMPIAIVIGNEGRGISKGIKENCDKIISIPMSGKINSLNASVAAATIIYDISSKRNII